jgi:hypothetical protein
MRPDAGRRDLHHRVCLLPEFLILKWNVPFYFGGTSLLIIVVVTMDFMAQVQSYVMSQQYESLLKKANFKNLKRWQRRCHPDALENLPNDVPREAGERFTWYLGISPERCACTTSASSGDKVTVEN